MNSEKCLEGTYHYSQRERRLLCLLSCHTDTGLGVHCHCDHTITRTLVTVAATVGTLIFQGTITSVMMATVQGTMTIITVMMVMVTVQGTTITVMMDIDLELISLEIEREAGEAGVETGRGEERGAASLGGTEVVRSPE